MRRAWKGQLDRLRQPPGGEPRNRQFGLQQVDLFGQVTRVLQLLARSHPLLLILDDVQWADAGSVSLLFHLGRRLAGSRILVVAAYRPDTIAPPSPDGARHPLETVVTEIQRVSGDRPIDLDQCEGRQFVEALLDAEPNRLSAAFRAQLVRHTEGHPLFTVELLRSLQESGGLVRDAEGRWVEGAALHWEKLPARVEAVIAERIGRLPDRCRALLAVASVEGEEFTAEAVAGCWVWTSPQSANVWMVTWVIATAWWPRSASGGWARIANRVFVFGTIYSSVTFTTTWTQ